VFAICGTTYTKKTILEIKAFFEEMDRENKGYITADDYARHFHLTSNAQKHARNVFETLDK